MVKPYIVKFISSKSDVGKTRIASSVVSILKSRGYVVGVVKHCSQGIDIEDKDSHIYLRSGADFVVASSRDIGIVYYSKWVDSLQHVIAYIDTPIIIVEGFKESSIGDTVVVSENIKEALTIDTEHKAIAYVIKELGEELNQISNNVYTLSDTEKISNLIEEKALSYIYSQLPQINCGYCGFNTCIELALAYAKGLARDCPMKTNTKVIVNNKEIELNPFVKRILKSIILGFIGELKGVPKERKNVIIKIEDEIIG